MLPLILSTVLLGCIAGTHGQGPRINPLDIGIFDGRLIGIDDLSLPTYQPLRSFLGVNQLPGANVVVPGRGGVLAGGVAPVGVPVYSPITVGKLRRCQKKVCPKGKIQKDCRYTPVLQDLSGEYCRGCDQDICLDLNMGRTGLLGGRGINSLAGRDRDGRRVRGDNDRSDRKEERKQMRKVRRRICRQTNVCLGDSRQEMMQGQLRRSLLGDARGRGGARGGVLGGNLGGAMGGNLINNIAGAITGAIGNLANQRPGMINPGPIIGGGLLGNLLGQSNVPILGQPQIPIVGQVGLPVLPGQPGLPRFPVVGNAGMGRPPVSIISQAQPGFPSIPVVGNPVISGVGQPPVSIVSQAQPVLTG